MLRLEGLDAGYGAGQVLRGLSLEVRAGAVTCLMGRNGVGKTTLMKCITGLLPARAGRIILDGAQIEGLPAHQIARRGIGYVPQGRRLFGPMTVAENLEIGLMARKGVALSDRQDPASSPAHLRQRVLELFPRLAERLDQVAATLSGGEQQMLAIARALCLDPKVLLLDEPTEGLQPSMITLIQDVVVALKSSGVATILVEQRIDAVLRMADHVAFMDQGRIAEVTGPLTAAAPQFRHYIGV